MFPIQSVVNNLVCATFVSGYLHHFFSDPPSSKGARSASRTLFYKETGVLAKQRGIAFNSLLLNPPWALYFCDVVFITNEAASVGGKGLIHNIMICHYLQRIFLWKGHIYSGILT